MPDVHISFNDLHITEQFVTDKTIAFSNELKLKESTKYCQSRLYYIIVQIQNIEHFQILKGVIYPRPLITSL